MQNEHLDIKLSPTEVDKRIELARQAAQREKDTAEFVQSLGPNDETVKRIYNPEAWVLRDKFRSAANRGEVTPPGCKHPLQHLQQYVDFDPSAGRHERAVNLFECGICHTPIWFVDPWGRPIQDE